MLDELLWQRDVDGVHQRLDGLVPGLRGLLELLDPLKLLAGVFLQLVQGVELARELREVVVELGELLDLDGLHGHRDVGFLALGRAAGQLALERRGVAGGQAGQRVVQAVEHRAAAELVRLAGRLGVLDELAVHARGQVDRRVVAVLRRALRGLEAGEALAQVVQVLIDVLVGDLGVVDGDAERGEVGKLELRPDLDLGGERQVLAVVELGDLARRAGPGRTTRPPARPWCRTRAARRSPPRSAPRRGRSACR